MVIVKWDIFRIKIKNLKNIQRFRKSFIRKIEKIWKSSIIVFDPPVQFLESYFFKVREFQKFVLARFSMRDLPLRNDEALWEMSIKPIISKKKRIRRSNIKCCIERSVVVQYVVISVVKCEIYSFIRIKLFWEFPWISHLIRTGTLVCISWFSESFSVIYDSLLSSKKKKKLLNLI